MTNLSNNAIARIAQVIEEDLYKKVLQRKFDLDLDAYEDTIPGGYSDGRHPSEFILEQVILGIEVELEHTDDPYLALEITLDHLSEEEKYYTYLEDMEEEMTHEIE